MTHSPLRIPTINPSSASSSIPTGATGYPECTRTFQRLTQGKFIPQEDTIAVEADLTIQLGNQPEITLARTPGDDLNLIMGHLFCNSLLETVEGVANIDFCHQAPSHATVSLDGSIPIHSLFKQRPPFRIHPQHLFELKNEFEHQQNLFKHTGSTHAAALFSITGHLLAFGEDVGRHNAFDKAIGRALIEGTLGQVGIAMLSSRIARELAAKAVRANIPVLCGFSAATSSGVNCAEENNITLVGRLRSNSFNIYANAWRIQDD